MDGHLVGKLLVLLHVEVIDSRLRLVTGLVMVLREPKAILVSL